MQVDLPYSIGYRKNAAQLAIQTNNKKALQLLMKEQFHRDEKKRARVEVTRSLINKQSTGQ